MLSKKLSVQNVFCLFTALFALGACTGSKGSNTAAVEDVVIVDLPVGDVEAMRVAEQDIQKAKVLDKVQKKESIKVQELIDIILNRHVSEAPSFGNDTALTSEAIVAQMQAAISAAASNDPSALKVQLETTQSQLSNTSVVYNSKATSVANFFRDSRLQCYSGTLLNVLLYKLSLKGMTDPSRIPVVIYESGHVLPGYIAQRGGDYRLFGVESTAEGTALIDYGFTNEVHEKVPHALRVVLMNDFLVIEALKDKLLLDVDTGKALIDIATDKLKTYKLNVAKLEERINDPIHFGEVVPAANSNSKKETVITADSVKTAFAGGRVLNESPFGFGKANEDGTDKVRTKIDKTVPMNSAVELLPEIAPVEEIRAMNLSVEEEIVVVLDSMHTVRVTGSTAKKLIACYYGFAKESYSKECIALVQSTYQFVRNPGEMREGLEAKDFSKATMCEGFSFRAGEGEAQCSNGRMVFASSEGVEGSTMLSISGIKLLQGRILEGILIEKEVRPGTPYMYLQADIYDYERAYTIPLGR